MSLAWVLSMTLLLLACVAPGTPDLAQGETFTAEMLFLPDPPAVGEQTLELQVFDLDSQPLEALPLEVDALMSAHGHGLQEPPVVGDLGDGLYRASWVWPMAGVWTLQLSLPDRGDTAVVDVDVD